MPPYEMLKFSGKSIIMSETLGSRPMVGHMTLDHGIGVRIPASQPLCWSGVPIEILVISRVVFILTVRQT
jgi:hypothetical protein